MSTLEYDVTRSGKEGGEVTQSVPGRGGGRKKERFNMEKPDLSVQDCKNIQEEGQK